MKSKKVLSESGQDLSSDDCAVPFIPAWDLLEQQALTTEEAACVAITLLQRGIFAGPSPSPYGLWQIQGRIESISRRL